MDYKKKGEEELDLQKDDSLRVFKRYNHWSYVCIRLHERCMLRADFALPIYQAVKEETGDRGWVPVSSYLKQRLPFVVRPCHFVIRFHSLSIFIRFHSLS